MRKRRRKGGQDEEYAERGAIEVVFLNFAQECMETLAI